MREPELQSIDAIYDALDRGEPETALDLARAALHAQEEDDPVLRFLCGVALLELARAPEAVRELERAVEGDPDDPEFRSQLALALFRGCRFAEAEAAARRATRAEQPTADAHWVLALLLERSARGEEAEEQFAAAAALDPEAYPLARRIDEEEFDRELRLAIDALPERFRRHLDDVAVLVEELPSDALLLAESPPLEPDTLLGLFDGVALDERSVFSTGGDLPPRIHLFKRNLERFAPDREELREQIAVTLKHELGHYLGLDEDELEASGYA